MNDFENEHRQPEEMHNHREWDGWWRQKNGNEIHITRMTDGHIKNSIKMIMRNPSEESFVYADIMQIELDSRETKKGMWD